ncbi:MAG TPA: hypothetical protein VGN88_11065 [Phycisphaerae bacterium]
MLPKHVCRQDLNRNLLLFPLLTLPACQFYPITSTPSPPNLAHCPTQNVSVRHVEPMCGVIV